MDEEEKPSYVYGPVPSRRLGRSLGLDLVPYKVCTYDCIYCQLGRTTNKTTERREWVPLDSIIEQLKARLSSKPDIITLSGSGEPTLHSGIGRLIEAIKGITDVPVAVITNGSLLWLPEVQTELLQADLVVPSLDAPSEDIFRYVNQPHPDITFDQMLTGLGEFRQVFRGQYWLEVFLLAGVTTVEERVKALAGCIQSIGPDNVQVNTVLRPPAEAYATAVPRDRLEEIAAQLYPATELILPWSRTEQVEPNSAGCEGVLDLVRRRPCSITDIAAGLRVHPHEAAKCIGQFMSEGKVRTKEQQGTLYYEATF